MQRRLAVVRCQRDYIYALCASTFNIIMIIAILIFYHEKTDTFGRMRSASSRMIASPESIFMPCCASSTASPCITGTRPISNTRAICYKETEGIRKWILKHIFSIERKKRNAPKKIKEEVMTSMIFLALKKHAAHAWSKGVAITIFGKNGTITLQKVCSAWKVQMISNRYVVINYTIAFCFPLKKWRDSNSYEEHTN